MKIKSFNWLLKIILFKNIKGITLYPFGIYFKDISKISSIDKTHEKIHWEQQKEMLCILFYIWYITEWFIKLYFTTDAYRSISFEREAFNNERKLKYIETRKRYNWLKYIFNDKKKYM